MSCLVCVSLVVAGTIVVGAPLPASGASPVGGAALDWHQCARTFRCGSLDVPIDYARPGAGDLALALVELPATTAHVVGDLVMNPGGPGASGVQFLEMASFPSALRMSFNLVSFDPRGVGESDPVRCTGASGIRSLIALDPAPQTAAQVAVVVKAAKAFDQSCAEHSPSALLEHVGTLDTVRDLDRIRAALGQPKLNYLGFSYGTYLGELYAQDYPSHVRAMVLDGVFDPALSSSELLEQQAVGFESDLKDFFAWCPRDKTCSQELPAGAKTEYQRLFADIAHGDLVVADLPTQYGGTQVVTLGVATTAVLGSLYSDQTWPYLAGAIAQAMGGNGDGLAVLAYAQEGMMPNGQFANLIAAGTATSCLDRSYPSGVTAYEELAQQLAKVAPDFGADAAWSDFACAYWPVPSEGRPQVIQARGSPPILVVGSTGDPATPYAWAQAVTHQLARAELLTRSGPGHTAYFNSKCIENWVGSYLVTLRLPPAGTVCPSTS
ncbi:MAG TPA: alpha/beta hydrolase [Acidimicrobiales bacterium]|nr:alpha/beta hydrolase [Acidimicrobiales bacterium]